jgi:hypothetical protein
MFGGEVQGKLAGFEAVYTSSLSEFYVCQFFLLPPQTATVGS